MRIPMRDQADTAWSVSRMQAWQTCRYAYWLRYIARVAPSQNVSPERVHGRLVHAGLEAAFTAARFEPNGPGLPPMPPNQKMIIYRREARHGVMSALIHGAPVANRQRDAAWHEVARVLEMIPVPAPGAIILIERHFSIHPGEFLVNGVIDYGVRTGPHSAHLRDWKTGAIPKTPEELKRNIQLAIYAAAIAGWFQWLRTLTVGLYSTRSGREVITTIGNDVIAWALGQIETIAREERSVGQLVHDGAQTAREAYPINSGQHCVRCDFRSYCPIFAKAPLPVRDPERVEKDKQRVTHLLTRP